MTEDELLAACQRDDEEMLPLPEWEDNDDAEATADDDDDALALPSFDDDADAELKTNTVARPRATVTAMGPRRNGRFAQFSVLRAGGHTMPGKRRQVADSVADGAVLGLPGWEDE